MDIFTQLTGIVFTGLTFWIAAIILLGLLAASYFSSNGFLLFLTVVLSAVVLTSTEWYNSFVWLLENPFMVLGGIFGYVMVGGIWSIIDWYLYVNKSTTKEMIRSRIQSYQNGINDNLIRNEVRFLEKTGIKFDHFEFQKNYNEISEKLKNEGKLKEITLDDFLKSDANPLNIGKYKWRFIGKMAYWPFSIISFLLKDFLVEIFNRIYDSLGNLYNRISENVIQKIFETRQ